MRPQSKIMWSQGHRGTWTVYAIRPTPEATRILGATAVYESHVFAGPTKKITEQRVKQWFREGLE